VKRRFRLTRSVDIKRVRRSGKSYAHPLVLLYTAAAGPEELHICVTAGLAVGNAVKRNRAKRLLRAALTDLLPEVLPGSDLLLIARPALARADLGRTREALTLLLDQAGLLSCSHGG
jgi:ribonuclease P protein component